MKPFDPRWSRGKQLFPSNKHLFSSDAGLYQWMNSWTWSCSWQCREVPQIKTGICFSELIYFSHLPSLSLSLSASAFQPMILASHCFLIKGMRLGIAGARWGEVWRGEASCERCLEVIMQWCGSLRELLPLVLLNKARILFALGGLTQRPLTPSLWRASSGT